MRAGRTTARRRAVPTRALLGLVLTAALAAGCQSSSSPTGATPTAPTSAAGTGSGPSTTAVDAVDHRMTAPGPRTGGLVAHADILVTSEKTLSKQTIAAVKATEGVYDVDVISVSQSVIEDRALTVAAVDPATYRNFTNAPAANTQAVWDRVADGELALKNQLKSSLPIDARGYLKLGSAADAPQIHVGAYTPQSPLIDAVVNDSWIPTLGMVPDNAMLIRTADTAPQKVRKPLQQLLGKDVSIQLVDIATRKGLDPQASQVAVVTGSVADAVGVYHYTVLGGGQIAPDPSWVAAHIVTEPVPILGDVTCNKVIFPQLRAALQDIVAQGLASAIKPGEYAGCYYPRFIAGSTTLSNHAFGLALDINAIENQRGTAGTLPQGVINAFEKWGFTWGGTWHYTDPMHFEMNKIVSPGGVDARSAAPSADASGR